MSSRYIAGKENHKPTKPVQMSKRPRERKRHNTKLETQTEDNPEDTKILTKKQ